MIYNRYFSLAVLLTVFSGSIACCFSSAEMKIPAPNPKIYRTEMHNHGFNSKIALSRLDGFKDLKFGTALDGIEKNPLVAARCKDKLNLSKKKPEYAGQKIEEWMASCVADVAGRFAKMVILFDQENKLYSIKFIFKNTYKNKSVKELDRGEVVDLISDIRAVLDVELGEPLNLSERVIFYSPTYHIVWSSQSSDDSPHRAVIELYLETGFLPDQYIAWKDITRSRKLELAKQKERNERIKAEGL